MIFRKILTSHFFGLVVSSALCIPNSAAAWQGHASATGDSVVNTRYNEIKPVLSPDGKMIYFTRSNHPLNVGGRRDKGDVWKAEVGPDGNWLNARQESKTFNSSQLNMIVGFSADGKEVYFQTYDPETKGKRQPGIYKMPLSGGSPKPVTIHYFFNAAKYQDATLSQDGKVMLLSMESYSTYGLEDLYVSFLQPDGSWSEPKNLGQDINTPKQEMAAWLSGDSQTLYFTSNGHGGSGSMDIFRTRRLDGSWKRWSTPENLGAGVNTAGSDMYYSEGSKGKWAFYSSTQNSEGFGDIKKVPVPERQEEAPVLAQEEPSVVVSDPVAEETEEIAQVTESGADPIEDVTVLVRQSFDLETRILNEEGAVLPANIRISQASGSFSEESASTGTFALSLPEAGSYQVKVQAPGYFAVDTSLQITEGTNSLSLRLKPVKVGETVRLRNVMFGQSTAVLLEESNAALDEVVELMKDNPKLEILLTGHTDNQGNSKANIKLSRERVEAVKNYLISRGIAEERIEGKGYGGTKPIASNASEETRKLNRRVEFVVTKK